MFQPVGSLPPNIYWRRRLFVLGVPAILLVLTLYVVFFSGSGKTDSGASTPPGSKSSSVKTSTQQSSSSQSSSSSSASTGSVTCAPAALQVRAATGAPSYKVGQQAALFLVVTNVGTKACNQDLADKQVELTVFTGDVRVWGSHDCQVQPGTSVQKLARNKPVRLEVAWSSKTSKPGCGGTRLQVQAGTYQLFATLAGKKSPPVTFTVT
ncbi:MAG: hypothetical protein ACR2KJ_15890 [Jatrophihabitans sp.]